MTLGESEFFSLSVSLISMLGKEVRLAATGGFVWMGWTQFLFYGILPLNLRKFIKPLYYSFKKIKT